MVKTFNYFEKNKKLKTWLLQYPVHHRPSSSHQHDSYCDSRKLSTLTWPDRTSTYEQCTGWKKCDTSLSASINSYINMRRNQGTVFCCLPSFFLSINRLYPYTMILPINYDKLDISTLFTTFFL